MESIQPKHFTISTNQEKIDGTYKIIDILTECADQEHRKQLDELFKRLTAVHGAWITQKTFEIYEWAKITQQLDTYRIKIKNAHSLATAIQRKGCKARVRYIIIGILILNRIKTKKMYTMKPTVKCKMLLIIRNLQSLEITNNAEDKRKLSRLTDRLNSMDMDISLQHPQPCNQVLDILLDFDMLEYALMRKHNNLRTNLARMSITQ